MADSVHSLERSIGFFSTGHLGSLTGCWPKQTLARLELPSVRTIVLFPSKAPFTLDKNTHQHPLTSGICHQWERVQSTFIPGWNGSAVVMGICRLKHDTQVDTLVFGPFPAWWCWRWQVWCWMRHTRKLVYWQWERFTHIIKKLHFTPWKW